MAQFAGSAHWAEPSPLFAHRARPTQLKRITSLYRLGVSQAQKAKVSEDERPRLRAYSLCPQLSFFTRTPRPRRLHLALGLSLQPERACSLSSTDADGE